MRGLYTSLEHSMCTVLQLLPGTRVSFTITVLIPRRWYIIGSSNCRQPLSFIVITQTGCHVFGNLLEPGPIDKPRNRVQRYKERVSKKRGNRDDGGIRVEGLRRKSNKYLQVYKTKKITTKTKKRLSGRQAVSVIPFSLSAAYALVTGSSAKHPGRYSWLLLR